MQINRALSSHYAGAKAHYMPIINSQTVYQGVRATLGEDVLQELEQLYAIMETFLIDSSQKKACNI